MAGPVCPVCHVMLGYNSNLPLADEKFSEFGFFSSN